jgi:hypothetical protein
MNTNKIPEQIESLAASAKIFDDCEKVGKKFSLHIDQIGELDSQVRQVLYGQTKSSDFITNIQENLEINHDLAEKIAAEINKEIFETVKNELQKETSESTINNLEQMGGFSIEKSDSAQEEKDTVVAGDRTTILNSLENPPTNPNHNFSEPLVDHLLGNSAGQEEEKVVAAPAPTPATETKNNPVPEKNSVPANLPIVNEPEKKPEVRKGPDPYREAI